MIKREGREIESLYHQERKRKEREREGISEEWKDEDGCVPCT